MISRMSTLESIKAAMAATNGLFGAEVIAKRNYDAFDQIYTSNARILPPGAPMVTGRDEIKKFWKGFIESANVVAGTLESVDVMQAGNDIVEIGKAVIQVQPDQGETASMEVKYVVYWREEDGRWKWHVDIWNANA